MQTVNKATILGRLGNDPEIRDLPDGGRVANISVATSESWKDEGGQWQERVEWHRVTMFGDYFVKAAEKLTRGSKVYLEGQLQTRKFTDKSEIERQSTEIVLRPYSGMLAPLDAPPKAEERPAKPSPRTNRRTQQQPRPSK